MKAGIDLQSLLDTHEDPFVIIDKDYRIVAVNRAYERVYRTQRVRVLGLPCFQVGHGRGRPCDETGEVCPHRHLFSGKGSQSCLHTHLDAQGRKHWVRVTVHPLRGTDGELYLGERYHELSIQDHHPNTGPHMVGHSHAFLSAIEQMKLAAQTDAPVLIQGETGTGKELAASFIHQHSARKDRPFFTLDCTVISPALFESEVFGHVRGAFTGSVGEKKGLFELAEGGTLFLDEIGEMSSAGQAKLLRVLESGEFRRVGGRKTLQADVRVICASNRNLWEAVQAGRFREDVYYRIACLSVHMPSLAERLEDIPELAESLLERICRRTKRKHRLAERALGMLVHHTYPGNVRELRNILEAAAAHCRDGEIDEMQLEQVLNARPRSRSPDRVDTRAEAARDATGTDSTRLEALEAKHIEQLLAAHGGNRREAAAALGISERTLYRRLRRYGLR